MQQQLHKSSHNSLHTQWIFTIRSALESWDRVLTIGASNCTMRAMHQHTQHHAWAAHGACARTANLQTQGRRFEHGFDICHRRCLPG
jgi:hypothetical protein